MKFLLGVLLGVALVQQPSLRESDPPLVLPREYVLGSCTLGGAAHVDEDGYFTCGTTQVFIDLRNDLTLLHLRGEVGQKGELIWRRTR